MQDTEAELKSGITLISNLLHCRQKMIGQNCGGFIEGTRRIFQKKFRYYKGKS